MARTFMVSLMVFLGTLIAPVSAQNLIIIRDVTGAVRASGDIGTAPDGSVRVKVKDNQGNIPADGTLCTLTNVHDHSTVTAKAKSGEASFEGVMAGDHVLTVEGAAVHILEP